MTNIRQKFLQNYKMLSSFFSSSNNYIKLRSNLDNRLVILGYAGNNRLYHSKVTFHKFYGASKNCHLLILESNADNGSMNHNINSVGIFCKQKTHTKFYCNSLTEIKCQYLNI